MKGSILAGCALLLAACGGSSSSNSSDETSGDGGQSYQLRVSYEPELGGTVSDTEFLNLQSDDVVTVTATPAAGYEFAGWYDVDHPQSTFHEKISDDLEIGLLAEDAPNVIEARFSLIGQAAPVSLPPEGSYALFAADNAREGLAFVVTEEETVGDGRQGIWRTQDGGQSWEKVSDEPVEFLTVGTGDPGYIVAGFDEFHVISSDGGDTWSRGSINEFGVREDGEAVDGNIYIAATSGLPAQRGLYRSQDGGNSWTHLFTDTDVEDDSDALLGSVGVSPSEPKAIYVGPQFSSNMHRSSDGGDSWFSIQAGLTTESDLLTEGIRVDPENADRLFVRNNLSVNGGANWTQHDWISPARTAWLDGNLITIEESMVRVSEDFGDSWRDVMPVSTDVEIPFDWPDRIYMGEEDLYFHGSDIEPLYRIELDAIREQID